MAPQVRKADADECWAAAHKTPIESLIGGLQASEKCFTVLHEDRPIAMFGVVARGPASPDFPRIGIVWMLGTDEVIDLWRAFGRWSKVWLGEVAYGYDALMNYVDARNTRHLRWLHWLGFETVKVHNGHGPEKLPFHEVVKLTVEHV